MKSGTRDKTEGKWHKIKGKIKQVAGKAVLNRGLETEGMAKNIDGKVQDRSARSRTWLGSEQSRACNATFKGLTSRLTAMRPSTHKDFGRHEGG